MPVVEIPTLLAPVDKSLSATSTTLFAKSTSSPHGAAAKTSICDSLSTVMSGIPCQALTLTPLSLTTTGVDSKSNGGSDQIEQRHLPVGSATSPDQTLFASPSLPWKSRLIIFCISSTISTSLDPSLRSSIRLTERATKSSADAKFESWNISILEEPPILISGVSLNTLI